MGYQTTTGLNVRNRAADIGLMDPNKQATTTTTTCATMTITS